MPDFLVTNLKGRVRYIGTVKKRADDLKSHPIDFAQLTLDGIEGEDHGGRVRASCSRVSMMYQKGTEIANARQLSIMSAEELAEIASLAGLPDNRPEWWGASLCLEGIPELSALPPSSRLIFPSGASIRVDAENGTCIFASTEVATQAGGDVKKVKESSKNRRGLVGSVEAVGRISINDECRVVVPNARPYNYLERGMN